MATTKAEGRRQKAEGRDQQKELKTLRVKQVRSGIGCTPQMRESLRALGLRRMNQVVERKDTPEVRGLINSIRHLVQVVD